MKLSYADFNFNFFFFWGGEGGKRGVLWDLCEKRVNSDLQIGVRRLLRLRVLSSEHAQFKIFRCLTVMRMPITENSKSFSSSNLKVSNNTFKRSSQCITT